MLAGQSAFDAGNYEKAAALWRESALRGNSDAQVFIGLAYANGWGVKKNMQQASMWYHIAAENNNSSGQLLLGLYYVASEDKNLVNIGLMWLQRAAANGDETAQRFLQKGEQRNWFKVTNRARAGGKAVTEQQAAVDQQAAHSSQTADKPEAERAEGSG